MSLPTEVKKMDMISEGMTNYPDKVIATMLSEEEEALSRDDTSRR